MKIILKIMVTASLCASVSFAAPQKGTMKDPRDGKTYKTVKIGNQVWMAENLAFEIGGNAGSTSECLIAGGNGKIANCKQYGLYYSAVAAFSTACPDGWHLPSVEEFEKLLNYAQSSVNLKSKNGWNTYPQPSGNGKDKYGFNARPAGACMVITDGGKCLYMDEGNYSYFWTSTNLAYAFLGAPHADYGFDVAKVVDGMIMEWYPVRCIKD